MTLLQFWFIEINCFCHLAEKRIFHFNSKKPPIDVSEEQDGEKHQTGTSLKRKYLLFREKYILKLFPDFLPICEYNS